MQEEDEMRKSAAIKVVETRIMFENLDFIMWRFYVFTMHFSPENQYVIFFGLLQLKRVCQSSAKLPMSACLNNLDK